MATPTTSLAAAFLGLGDEDTRKAVLKATHPLYDELSETWDVFKAAYEGDGGFLDGSYLWRYPNEIPEDFKDRQTQARYHNYARSLVDLYVGHLLGKDVSRDTTTDELKAFWADVDGAGTSLSDFLRRAVTLALAIGHAGILIDKTADRAAGPSRAEETGRVILRLYLPQAILDWRLPDGDISAVKLREVVESPNLADTGAARATSRILLWTDTEWARFDEATGDLIADGIHALGMAPFVVIRPIPSAVWGFIGNSLFGNANVFKALFNRSSEEDQTLRGQAFSILTVNVPTDGQVADVKTQLGSDIGTMRALVVQGDARYITADMQAPEQIRTNIAYLVAELYRMAQVPFQRDSKEAESGEAIALKHRELNDRLTAVATDLERAEKQIALGWFAWMSPSPEAAVTAFEASETTVAYSREFFIADMLSELEKWAQALTMELGPTYDKHVRKHLVRQLSPTLDAQTQEAIDQEIESAPTMRQTPAEQLAAAAAARSKSLAGGGQAPPEPDDMGA